MKNSLKLSLTASIFAIFSLSAGTIFATGTAAGVGQPFLPPELELKSENFPETRTIEFKNLPLREQQNAVFGKEIPMDEMLEYWRKTAKFYDKSLEGICQMEIRTKMQVYRTDDLAEMSRFIADVAQKYDGAGTLESYKKIADDAAHLYASILDFYEKNPRWNPKEKYRRFLEANACVLDSVAWAKTQYWRQFWCQKFIFENPEVDKFVLRLAELAQRDPAEAFAIYERSLLPARTEFGKFSDAFRRVSHLAENPEIAATWLEKILAEESSRERENP